METLGIVLICIGVLVGILGIVFSLLRFLRWEYTYNCMRIADMCVSNYCSELLAKREYDVTINYYKRYKYDYNKHMYNLTLWGRYSAIKPEYRELLKKYDTKITKKGFL